jgi:uncharacterized membrane protein YhaH (DUF805 family)
MRRRTYGLIWLVSHFVVFLPALNLFVPKGILNNILNSRFAFIVWLMLIVLAGVVHFFATTKRLHDMDESGQMAFLTVAPVVGTMYGAWILFQPYSDLGGENKYGFNPRFPSKEESA